MSGEKYIGLDVHQATISVAVMDAKGKLGPAEFGDGLRRFAPGKILRLDAS